MLPPDLAGMVQELQQYEFTSSEAREKFDELMDQLRQEMAQSYFNQMSGAMQEMSPEAMQRMKDMLNDLNDLLAMKEAGQDTQPAFEQFMERYGDFFPENPATLDELLEIMAQRMAAMQAMLNSMTPEQRAQLQGLSEALLEDMDLRWQMDQLGGHLQQLFPQMGWERRYDFSGQDPLGFAEAAQMLNELGDLDQLEQMLRGASSPGALAEVDVDRARDLLGDDAARSLEQLSKLAQQLEDAGLINNKEGKLELTPKGLRKIGRNALSDLFSKLAQRQARPPRDRAHRASATSAPTTPSPTSSATRSTSTSSAPSATPSAARAAARRCASRRTTSRSSRPSRSCAAPRC